MNIAIADDEDDIRHYYQSVVSRLGHNVVVAAVDGRDLIEQCRDRSPDLIITDLNMPEIDGIEATRRICCEHPVPVIVVTARDPNEFVEREGITHVVDCLIKPVNLHDLELAITRATALA